VCLHVYFSTDECIWLLRQYVKDAENRLNKLQKTCRYFLRAHHAIMLAYVLALCIEFLIKASASTTHTFEVISSWLYMVVYAIYSTIVGAFMYVYHGIVGTIMYMYHKIKSVFMYLFYIIKENLVAAYTLFQTISTIMMIASIVFYAFKIHEYMTIANSNHHVKNVMRI